MAQYKQIGTPFKYYKNCNIFYLSMCTLQTINVIVIIIHNQLLLQSSKAIKQMSQICDCIWIYLYINENAVHST